MSSEKIRAEFEAAYAEFSARAKGFGDDEVKIALMRDDDDGYLYGAANEAWWAWQASRASSAVEALRDLLPDLDEALEDLELFGLHSDQGYRKLKDWYRKMLATTKAIDAALSGEGAAK